MPYDIKLLPTAELSFTALPVDLQAVLEKKLNGLADDPLQTGGAMRSPGPNAGMVLPFEHGPVDGKIHHFCIYFRFGQDEQSLIIREITHHEFDDDAPYWELH